MATDRRDDRYDDGSFPASDPPSTWWGESRDRGYVDVPLALPELADLPPYTDRDRDLDLRWWAAANYLSVAQIYLKSNPLLREPLVVGDIKPRLLGHWGTSPGLSMVYTLVNRLIRETGTDAIFVTGPGHGGPSLLANAYLEGTYSEVYPRISPNLAV